jgi:putative hydrolase of the HAD superfamily
MNSVKAIGFDLFNTLITIDPGAMPEAFNRLAASLKESGLLPEKDSFKKAYRESALRFMAETKVDGRETHNRFWISEALNTLGQRISPDDESIARAVDAYFSTFYDYYRLIPGTEEMLERISLNYRVGLLSNFTHAPAVMRLLELTGLAPFFDITLVSGAIGFRKPHPMVFQMLVERLDVEKDYILYVGDDLGPDVMGAQKAGIRPVWMTYVQDHKLPVLPGLGSGPDNLPGSSVPRVSDWNDLLALLGRI